MYPGQEGVGNEFKKCVHDFGDGMIQQHYPHNRDASAAFDAGWKEGFLALQQDTSFNALTRVAEQAVLRAQHNEHAAGVGLCLGALANLGDGDAPLLLGPIHGNKEKTQGFENFFNALKICLHNNRDDQRKIVFCLDQFYNHEVEQVIKRNPALSTLKQIAQKNQEILHFYAGNVG